MTEARMQELPNQKPGSFCWVELGTTNAEGAKNFYGELFGWDYEDHSMGPDGMYTIVKLNGKDVNWRTRVSDGGLLLTLLAARPLRADWAGSMVDDRWRLEIHLREQ